jgi:hypothetical protein
MSIPRECTCWIITAFEKICLAFTMNETVIIWTFAQSSSTYSMITNVFSSRSVDEKSLIFAISNKILYLCYGFPPFQFQIVTYAMFLFVRGFFPCALYRCIVKSTTSLSPGLVVAALCLILAGTGWQHKLTYRRQLSWPKMLVGWLNYVGGSIIIQWWRLSVGCLSMCSNHKEQILTIEYSFYSTVCLFHTKDASLRM